MRNHIYAWGAVLLAGTLVPAVAQTTYTEVGNAPRWHIDSGYSATTGRTSDFLDGGWIIGGGVQWRVPGTLFSIRGDLDYSRYDSTSQALTLGAIQNQTFVSDGWGEIFGLNVDGVLNIPISPAVRSYILAGIGVAYRRIQLTQTVAVGGIICDPWWGFCAPGFFPGSVLVNSESTTRFAWNAGFGFEFPLYPGQSWFIEALYQRIETQEPTEIIPIRVGLRF